jgi:hypothetical protein
VGLRGRRAGKTGDYAFGFAAAAPLMMGNNSPGKMPKEIDTKESGKRRGRASAPSEVNRLNFGFFLTTANFVEYGVSLPKLHLRPCGIPGA